jgi:hypothetical protein
MRNGVDNRLAADLPSPLLSLISPSSMNVGMHMIGPQGIPFGHYISPLSSPSNLTMNVAMAMVSPSLSLPRQLSGNHSNSSTPVHYRHASDDHLPSSSLTLSAAASMESNQSSTSSLLLAELAVDDTAAPHDFIDPDSKHDDPLTSLPSWPGDNNDGQVLHSFLLH